MLKRPHVVLKRVLSCHHAMLVCLLLVLVVVLVGGLCLSFGCRMCFRMEFSMLEAGNTVPHANAVCARVSGGCVLQLHVKGYVHFASLYVFASSHASV